MTHPELRLEGVMFAPHGNQILGPLDLVVPVGEPLALTGPSGAGKTTLCLIMAGVLKPTDGRVLLDGVPFHGDGATVGLVLQTHGLLAGLTAAENVALPLQSRRLARHDIAGRTASGSGLGGTDRRSGSAGRRALGRGASTSGRRPGHGGRSPGADRRRAHCRA